MSSVVGSAALHSEGDGSDLPKLLAEIAEVIGREAALLLAEEFGGTEIFVPATAQKAHRLARIIGPEATEQLCRYFRIGMEQGFSGVRLLIPMASGVRSTTRQRVADALADGLSLNESALVVGIHTRSVSRHRAALARDAAARSSHIERNRR
jgi:hypothetical protein